MEILDSYHPLPAWRRCGCINHIKEVLPKSKSSKLKCLSLFASNEDFLVLLNLKIQLKYYSFCKFPFYRICFLKAFYSVERKLLPWPGAGMTNLMKNPKNNWLNKFLKVVTASRCWETAANIVIFTIHFFSNSSW